MIEDHGVEAAPPLTVVVNGQASGAPSLAERDDLVARLRAFGADVELEVTRSLGELADVWRRQDGRRIVLVGGDGSVHAAANLEGPPRDVAVIPAGRANNIARCTGIPTSRADAARLAATGRARPLDLIEARAGDRRQMVVEGVSAGYLAQARARYHGRNSADIRAGVRAGAAALARFRPLRAHVTGAGVDEDVAVSQLFVANLPLYEFGLHIAPHADPTDATLDLIGIEAPSRVAVAFMLVALLRDTLLQQPGVHLWRARQVTLHTGGRSPVIADSTNLGAGPVQFTAVPGALRLVRP